MANYVQQPIDYPSQVALWEPTLGRLELGRFPFVVESVQVGSPDIRDNTKNRALADGVFDDTRYHGSSAITVSARLVPHAKCAKPDYHYATLRDTIAAYCHPRLRPRLYWRYPGDPGPNGPMAEQCDGAGQWAEVRGASWPITVTGPRAGGRYPLMVAQFRNPLGQMFLGDPQSPPRSATAFPGELAEGRTYDLTFDRDYPDVDYPAGAAIILNNGNSYAGFELQVHGPFEAGATVVLSGVSIELQEALLINQSVTFKSLSKTILRETGNSYYPSTNFGEWDWDDLVLPHGYSFMTFDGALSGSPSGFATIEWRCTSV